MISQLLSDAIGGGTPPVHTTPDNPPIDPTALTIGIIFICFIVILILIPVTIYIIKSAKGKKKTFLTKQEIKLIAAFRASKNLPKADEISFQTLSDEEIHLLQEYRKTNNV